MTFNISSTVSFVLLIMTITVADQLAWIDSNDAIRAANLFQKPLEVTLFCGCCDNVIPQTVKVLSAEAQPVSNGGYTELIITYKENGISVSEGVDLAYVWISQNGEFKTIGEILDLSHDPCNRYSE